MRIPLRIRVTAAAAVLGVLCAAAPDTGWRPLSADLREGLVHLTGFAFEEGSIEGVCAGRRVSLQARFEMDRGANPGTAVEALVRLGPHDVARAPLPTASADPGALFTQTLSFRIPRGTAPGEHPLRMGIVRPGAAGESRDSLCPLLAPIGRVRVLPPGPMLSLPPEQARRIAGEIGQREGANLLVNGSFEKGFRGWEVGEGIREGWAGWDRVLSLELDAGTAAEGRQSVRIDFHGGQDPNFFHVVQEAAVQPSMRYAVHYALRTEALTSHEGPGVAVRDPSVPIEEFYVATPKALRLTGTHGWTLIRFEFETGPQTRRIRLILRRDGSGTAKYEPERFGPISGSAWFDGVQLLPAEAPAS